MSLGISKYSLTASITVPVRILSVNRLTGAVKIETLGGTRTLRAGQTVNINATASQDHG